jgi:hypothetical protein
MRKRRSIVLDTSDAFQTELRFFVPASNANADTDDDTNPSAGADAQL